MAMTFRQWQRAEIEMMKAEYEGTGITVAEMKECRTEEDYWRLYLLPHLTRGGSIGLPVCRWMAKRGRLWWVQKHFENQVPNVFTRTGRRV